VAASACFSVAHSGSQFDFHMIEFRCLASLGYSTLRPNLKEGEGTPRNGKPSTRN
jgi:hypothetical protein